MNTSFKRYSIAAELLTSVVYQPYMPTEIQPRYKTPIFAPFCSRLHGTHTPSFSTISLFMDNESGTFYQNALLGLQSAKIAQNIFINNLKSTFCPCHSFFSLASALNDYFHLVQYLYRLDFIVIMKSLWLSVLGNK